MKIARFAVAAGLALAAGWCTSAHAQTSKLLYSQTFEARDIGTEWSTNTKLVTPNTTFTTFNGNYSNSFTKLTLAAAAQPTGRNGVSTGGTGGSGGTGGGGTPVYYNLYTLTFDLYVIDSWDAAEPTYGIDRFCVLVNNTCLLDNTFSNHAGIAQSFRAPDVTRRNMGFGAWEDAIYRRVTVEFADPGTSTIGITFKDGGGLQGINDESWGIDNVNVTYAAVPAPAASAGLLGGLGLLSARRRRR
jgi:hypothetical protein